MEKTVPSDIRWNPLGFGGQLEMGRELEPSCQVRAITTQRDRKHRQGTSWGRKTKYGLHVELEGLVGHGGRHVW